MTNSHHDIEFIVNSTSKTANSIQDQGVPAELADIIDVIMVAFLIDPKADLDKSKLGCPWPVLNLNHAIMRHGLTPPNVWRQYLNSWFSAEGMEQLDIIGYPDHVRAVKQNYYQQTNRPTLH